MKASFFVLWLSMLCITILLTTNTITCAALLDEQPQQSLGVVNSREETCTCTDCVEDMPILGFVEYPIECPEEQSPVIGTINIAIESNNGFSYYSVDKRNKDLALAGLVFEYDNLKSKQNVQNCSMDSSELRYANSRYILIRARENVRYNIKTKCVSKRANIYDYDLTLSNPNEKYYYGTKVRVDIQFFNNIYETLDTYLTGTIVAKGDKTQQGVVISGRGKIVLLLTEEIFNDNEILLEYTPIKTVAEKRTISITIPVVRKASKGQLLVNKKQVIYSGKEFTLYFRLSDSDNGPTPTIDIPLLSISSSNNELYCQITNYINGYGFATCENIDTPGEHNLVLKYNGAVLFEQTITVQENPYQYVNEAIVLLLVIIVIITLLILFVGVVSFIIFYKKLNNNNGKNTARQQGRVMREEDAEELDNM